MDTTFNLCHFISVSFFSFHCQRKKVHPFIFQSMIFNYGYCLMMKSKIMCEWRISHKTLAIEWGMEWWRIGRENSQLEISLSFLLSPFSKFPSSRIVSLKFELLTEKGTDWKEEGEEAVWSRSCDLITVFSYVPFVSIFLFLVSIFATFLLFLIPNLSLSLFIRIFTCTPTNTGEINQVRLTGAWF